MSAMLPEHANAAKIARIGNMGGRNDASEGDRRGSVKSQPPVPVIKFGNGRGIKECQPMKLLERVRNIIVIPVNLANPIHSSHLNSNSSSGLGAPADHLPSVALIPSHTAPTNPATITVMAALKV